MTRTAPRLALFSATALLASALLLALPPRGSAYATLGVSLTPTVATYFSNPTSFSGSGANNNLTPDWNWPGALGADLAIRKAASEWAADPRGGTGAGDPTQIVGSGGSNFGWFFLDTTTSDGASSASCVVFAGGFLGSGVYAQASPSGSGFRITFDGGPENDWNWRDGPGVETGFKRVDIQGIAVHEFGHALGLAHTSVNGATMYPSTSTSGSSNQRSIESDDIEGVQAIYGLKSATKPSITSVSGSLVPGGAITITGTGFAATGNEVWFSQQVGPSATATPPLIVSNVTSTNGGTTIAVSIPLTAGAGDLAVRTVAGGGHDRVTSPWPFALQEPTAPTILTVSPTSVPVASLASNKLFLTGLKLAGTTSVAVGTRVYTGSALQITSDFLLSVTLVPPPIDLGPVEVRATSPGGTSAAAALTLLPATERLVIPETSTPAAGSTLVVWLASPAPGNFALLAVSECVVTTPIPPYVTFGIGGCGDLNFIGGVPPFGANGLTSVSIPVPAAFHGTAYLQFADTDALLSVLPLPTSWLAIVTVP